MIVFASRTVMTDSTPAPDSGLPRSSDVSDQPRGAALRDSAPLPAELQEKFVQDNLRRIFLQINRIVRNVHDAQDLTQEAFIKALQRQDQLKDEKKAAHWLSRIATNTALDYMRRNGRVAFCEAGEIPERHMETPEALLLRSERRDWLSEGLEKLTPRERAALVLRDVEDLPADEVARRLDCSKATVRSHIANGRIKFRKFLERRTK